MFEENGMVLGTAVGALVFLALAHSILGELSVLRPLFVCPDWTIGLPRRPTERLLRFAWHLTSIAWLVMAAVLLKVPPGIAVGIGSLASAALVFGTLRAHLAWPVFFVGGLAALRLENGLPPALRWVVIGAAVLVATGAGLLHVYWAGGGKRWLAIAVPPNAEGEPSFRPGPIVCALVALCLFGLAALMPWTALRPGMLNWITTAGILGILALRAAGDGRRMGFTKTDRDTLFGQADDAVFTPLVSVLAFGAFASLL